MRSNDDTSLVTPTSRTNPFPAKLKERYCLNKDGSKKCTVHVALDLSGSDLEYRAGDSIGIYPENHPDLVQKTLHALGATGDESVTSRDGESFSLRRFLTKKANIQRASKKLLTAIDPSSPMLEDRESFKKAIEQYELWDFIEAFGKEKVDLETIPSLVQALLPRLYSIASSRKVVGEEVHLTIATLSYTTNGIERHGVCTDYLWNQAPLGEAVVPCYLQLTKDFLLPEDDQTPIIMIGPGTGVAPFRSFMQERVARKAKGKNWLFFGEWTRENDFYYQEEWEELARSGMLQLSTAFSRDQEHKIYVQDKMAENAKELWSWIQEGAILYVCGDMHKMAKDVDQMLHQIVGSESDHDPKEFVKQLRKDGHYLRDVY